MSNATWKIEISHLCNTSHLQGIPELINKYIRTGIFCNILPSRDNFLPWISDHLTNSNQAFTPCAAAQKRGWALLRAPSPEHWGKGSRNTRKPDMALTAPKQQRFLLNKVLNHMFKRALMDVSMASSTLLNASVGRESVEKCVVQSVNTSGSWRQLLPACSLS